MKPARSWSLASELAEIEQAVHATVRLLEVIEGEHSDERLTRDISRSAQAVAELVHLRLRDIGRVLRGEVDSWFLHGPHNAMPSHPDVDAVENHGADVLFKPRASTPVRPKRR